MLRTFARAASACAAAASVWLVVASLAAGPALAAGDVAEQKASTSSYNLTLDIGPAAMMLTPDQAKAQKATTGEVMAAMPGMDTGASMAMAPGNRHVELHVSRKAGGAVVKDANVAITLTNTASNASIGVQPVVAMYGAAQGEADWHYGNNAELPDGTYRAVATVDGQAASFAPVTLGAASGAPGTAGRAAMPSMAPSTGGGGASFADLPEPVEVAIVVTLSVVAGVMLQRIKRAALGGARDAGIRR